MKSICEHPDHCHPDDYAAETCKANQLDGFHVDILCACCGEVVPCADRCFSLDLPEEFDGGVVGQTDLDYQAKLNLERLRRELDQEDDQC